MSGLRIIAGEARGRFLKTHKIEDLSIRPMLGRMKKSLFDILMPRLPGCRFLDLYAGTGAVGLEAISRGAAYADFVEMSPRSLKLVEENIAMLGWKDRTGMHRADVTKGLGWLTGPYNIIFMGPPYKDEKKRMLALTAPTLRAVAAANLLAPDGIVVAQFHDSELVSVPPAFVMYREEVYGDTVVSFYKAAPKHV